MVKVSDTVTAAPVVVVVVVGLPEVKEGESKSHGSPIHDDSTPLEHQ